MPPTGGGDRTQHKVTLKELFLAAQHDEFETVKDFLQLLLHGEASNEEECPGPSRRSKDDQRAAIATLLEPKTKNTLLHYACDNGNLAACKYLLMLEGMADASLNEPNAFGHTPLFYAASSGKLPLVKWLISNGADIDTDYSDREDVMPREGDLGVFTPLQIASFKGHDDVVNFLVECNAELSGTRRNGLTPLHVACSQNRRGVVKILLEAGADVHACDSDGRTPVDVADASMLATLLPDEHGGGGGDDDSDNGIEAADDDADDDDDDDDDTSDDEGSAAGRKRRQALDGVKSAFGGEIGRGFRSKAWKRRVAAIIDAGLCFQSAAQSKSATIKLFDGACQMIALGFQDAVAQVVSSCCSSLLKTAFSAVMGEKEFHTPQFHRERPVIQDIAAALLNRGASANEKDSSEAVASLLFLICKSVDLTRYLTAQIGQIMFAQASALALVSPATTDASGSVGGGAAASVSWRHQLVSIKILSAIASQYRLDQAASGLSFADALKISMASLENSSVYVRTASIDLLVQGLLIRCEQSEMSGSVDEIFEQMKSWIESIFKQQNQSLKPSIQAKINNGLREAIQGSKRLNTTETGGLDRAQPLAPKAARAAVFDDLAPATSPRSKNAQREEDLPYAEPIQEQHRADAVDMLACFGEKVTRCLLSNAWAPRVEALSFLQSQVDARQIAFDASGAGAQQRALLQAIQRTLLQALQDRVNSVYEAGVALLMEVAIAFDGSVEKRAQDRASLQELVRPLIPRLLVKLGDSKSRLHVTTEDALLLLSRQANSVGPEFVLDEMVACDRSASPHALSGVYLSNKLGLVSKLLLEFGVQESSTGSAGALPIKSVLQPALQACEHKDQSVRQASLQIVADALQVARSAAMPFLDALARSSRQKLISKLVEKGVLESDLLMDEVDDFDAEPPRPGTSSGVRPPTASGSSTKHRPALSSTSLSAASSAAAQPSAAQSQPAALPYGTALTSAQTEQFAALIDALGEELVRCLLDKAWAQREAAVREIERQVVCTANGKLPADRALPKTIDTLRVLSAALELGLNDTVARVFQCSLRLFQIVVADFVPLVASTHEYVDAILETAVGLVMQKLGDSKQRLRADCFTLLYSLASLSHIGHARMCKMLVDKYQQLARSAAATVGSPLLVGELLKLFTLLIKEASTGSGAGPPPRLDLAPILELIRPAFENKHVDVRNSAIATYVAIYEATSGGAVGGGAVGGGTIGGGVDLNSFLAQTKPAIRDAITRSVVQINKALPSAAGGESAAGEASTPEIDSARQQSLALDLTKLTHVCGAQTAALLTSLSPAARCQGVDKLMEAFVDETAPRGSQLTGAWEISCLLAKQLLLDGTPCVCLAALDLLSLLADPPESPEGCAAYAIPWGEWGVHLILGSTIRSVVQQTANESVRVRERVKTLLFVLATKNATGKTVVCNALLSAPEETSVAGEPKAKRARKIASLKLRWQLAARLELLYDLLLAGGAVGATDDARSAPTARRKSSSSAPKSSPSDVLGVDNIVPFLGSCAAHPSQSVRAGSLQIAAFLKQTRPDELARFIRDSCSAALQRRLHALMSGTADADSAATADHFNAGDATCVRGSRSSHVRRVAALRPPRSVPVEETKQVVDVFPPPHSAPGKSRRATGDDGEEDDSMNDGSYVVLQQREDRDESRATRQSTGAPPQVPIWLEHQSARKGGAGVFGDSEPEAVAVGGGAAGLMKMRRKSSYRSSNNNGDDDDSDARRTGAAARYSSVQGY
ncbi:hypothetical protein PybrP1_009216 [[Pythium] brassicae (nom. inval.)]|nr:hypothetical protein PybrP1_009216 [[Pythium] brassicae (nom. inval.)]